MNIFQVVLNLLRVGGTIMLTAAPIMFLWNGALVPAVPAVHEINYFQAIGLHLLAMLTQHQLRFYYITGAPTHQSEGEIKP